MKAFIIAGAAAIALAAPALAQDTNPANSNSTNGTQQYQPGTGRTSKPGVQGDTGSKNGPAAKDSSGQQSDKMNSGSEGASTGAAGSDNSNVPGEAGGKAGPSQAPSK